MGNLNDGSKVLRNGTLAVTIAMLVIMAGCGSKEPATSSATPPPVATAATTAPEPAATQPAAPVSQLLAANDMTWTPEAM